MIFIISDNYFLVNGIKELMRSKTCMHITGGNINVNIFQSIKKQDLVIIDAATPQYLSRMSEVLLQQPTVFFIIHIKRIDYHQHLFKPHFRTLNIRMPLSSFRGALLDALELKSKVSTHLSSLTEREMHIFRQTFKDLSVHQISKQSGIATKTVYSYRLNICKKLGLHRFIDAIPFYKLLSFFSRQNP